MKVKEFTVSRSIKLPVKGVQFSNQEAACSITVGVSEGEDQDKALQEAWDYVKEQVYRGMSQDVSSWLIEGLEQTKL